ncbi:hypothetical protein MOQ_006296 [Trypanosoma cruzi marinkellei]|uniref:Uncharacterized protein n=1 Tax=Trypanosoma cruzi marinkellei TaxID=85056 RepID=K2M4N6_TRYCR|nr:hypothetical protein MOQ_006296 [Trypanosoma cruzi marinkellei]
MLFLLLTAISFEEEVLQCCFSLFLLFPALCVFSVSGPVSPARFLGVKALERLASGLVLLHRLLWMGSRASKAVVNEPHFDRTTVDRLCKEAYAAGAGDASAHYQAVLESQWRMDAAAGLGGCAITLLLSYMYFGARMALSDAQASRLVEAERSHVVRLQQESDALQTQLGKLAEDNARLRRVVCRSAATMRRMSRRQTRLIHSLMRLRHRSASLAGEVEGLKNFLVQLNQRVVVMQCGGSVALGCLAAVCISAFVTSRWGSAGSGGGVTNTNGIHYSVGANGSAGATLQQQPSCEDMAGGERHDVT